MKRAGVHLTPIALRTPCGPVRRRKGGSYPLSTSTGTSVRRSAAATTSAWSSLPREAERAGRGGVPYVFHSDSRAGPWVLRLKGAACSSRAAPFFFARNRHHAVLGALFRQPPFAGYFESERACAISTATIAAKIASKTGSIGLSHPTSDRTESNIAGLSAPPAHTFQLTCSRPAAAARDVSAGPPTRRAVPLEPQRRRSPCLTSPPRWRVCASRFRRTASGVVFSRSAACS